MRPRPIGVRRQWKGNSLLHSSRRCLGDTQFLNRHKMVALLAEGRFCKFRQSSSRRPELVAQTFSESVLDCCLLDIQRDDEFREGA